MADFAARDQAAKTAAVRDQAAMVAAAWSPAGAPASWKLTAAQFETLRDDPELAALAATIPEDRVPPLLFEAAATYLVLELEPHPLRDWFPRVGEPQPELRPRFGPEYRSFCLSHRDRLLELCASHRYQMNEVGRCAHVVPALSDVALQQRPIALVDLGTGAGLALHLDRYHYSYLRDGERLAAVGDPRSPVLIETELRGSARPPVPARAPEVIDRVGIDIEPIDVSDPDVRSWLAACIPQEIGAVTRFDSAARLASERPARTVRGDAFEVLPAMLEQLSPEHLVCLVDTYVHVFFPSEELQRFRELVDALGSERDLDWVSIDPLVPMGAAAESSVLGLPVSQQLVQRARTGGVFGVVGRVSYRRGRKSGALLGVAHPGAAWLEWLSTSNET